MAKFNARSIFTIANKIGQAILSGAQLLFNKRVRRGEYNLKKLIEENPWYKVNGINQEARRWVQDYSKDHSVRYQKKFMEAGKLYYFKYLKPKHIDTLEYWDKAPLVLCLGGYWTKDHRWIEVGLNLHLLPPRTREKVLIKVFNMYREKYRSEMYSPNQRPLELNWKKVAKPLIVYGAVFAFRSYIPHLRSETIEFKYEDWDHAIFVPNEHLNKISERELTDRWQKFITERAWNKVSGVSLDKLIGGTY